MYYFSRSHLQISNNMPFPIIVSLSNNAWISENELEPIEEGETYCVPLLYAYASAIKFRPASLPCAWSTPVGCSLQAQDIHSTIEVVYYIYLISYYNMMNTVVLNYIYSIFGEFSGL
jgi:hypothetical protein